MELHEGIGGCVDGLNQVSASQSRISDLVVLVSPLSSPSRIREVTKGRQKRPPLYKEGAEAAVEKFRRDRDS